MQNGGAWSGSSGAIAVARRNLETMIDSIGRKADHQTTSSFRGPILCPSSVFTMGTSLRRIGLPVDSYTIDIDFR